MIKIVTYIFLLAGFIFLQSCNHTQLCSQQVKTLDSLSGAVNGMARELEKADTVMLQKAISRFTYYRQFIKQNINDTINKAEADNLQHFYVSGKALEDFSLNRRSILARAGLINSQLSKLNADAKSNAVEATQLAEYLTREKAEAKNLVEAGTAQQKIFHESLQEFKICLSGIEQLIRARNNGELPTIVKDTTSL